MKKRLLRLDKETVAASAGIPYEAGGTTITFYLYSISSTELTTLIDTGSEPPPPPPPQLTQQAGCSIEICP